MTTLIIEHHQKIATYSRRGIALNQIKSSEYWIVGANLAVKNFIFRFVDCCRLRGKLGEQKTYRLTETASFNHYGMEIFGPFIVKQRKSEVK